MGHPAALPVAAFDEAKMDKGGPVRNRGFRLDVYSSHPTAYVRCYEFTAPTAGSQALIIELQAFYDSDVIRQPYGRTEAQLHGPHEAGGHAHSRKPGGAHRRSHFLRQGD